MDYKEAYVREVGLRLPEKTREDIQNEIRSLIEDSLEDQAQSAGRPADDEMLLDVLRKLGPPDKTAAAYQPPRYIIGPELYPIFIQVLRIVLTVIVILGAVGFGISVGADAYLPTDISRNIASASAELFSSIVSTVGSIVIVFWIIQTVNPNIRISQQAWDPRNLRPVVDEDRVKIAEPVVGIFFNALILSVLYLYPEWLGITTITNGELVHAPIFTDAFFRYLPLITVLLVAEIIKDSLLVGAARWTPTIRWVAMGTAVLTAAIGILMLAGPAIIAIDPSSISRIGFGQVDADSAARISEAINLGARITIGIVAAVQFLEIGKHIWRMFGKRLPVMEVNH